MILPELTLDVVVTCLKADKKLYIYVILTCQKVRVDMYFRNYGKFLKLNVIQIIFVEQKEFKSCIRRKETKLYYNRRKQKDYQLAYKKVLCILNKYNDYSDKLFESKNKDATNEIK
jgi:hypothetical protein